MEQFKKAEFLEVGKVYADMRKDSKYTTYLKFVGSNPDKDNCVLFEYVSGLDDYFRVQNGLIGFLLQTQEVSPGVFSYDPLNFFIPTEDFLKSINCTKL